MPNSINQASFNAQTKKASAAKSNVASLSFEPVIGDQLSEFRFRLLNKLQTTLDIEQILSTFLRELRQRLPISGLHYLNGDQMVDIELGHRARHRCNYQLTMKQQHFGDLTFLRNRRFDERELIFIESVMDLLIFPLRNGLSYREALASAMIDPLTGLNNRGAMSITLNREMERARRHNDQDISIIMIDVDHFKQINDRYGHLAGDSVLRQVAQIIQKSIRGSDACFRYGGEEFLVNLTNSSLPLARIVAERIRQSIADHVRLPDAEMSISASCGVAHFNNEADWPALVQRADKALFSAKEQGRNRVVTAIA